MKNLFIARMKCLLRDRSTLFWTLLFPLLLSTLFFVAFGHLHSDQDIVFDPIPVAVVDNEAYAGDTLLQETLSAVSLPQDNALLDMRLASAQQAHTLLEEGAVSGVITPGDTPTLAVRQSGLTQSVLKAFLDQYVGIKATVTHLAALDPAAAQQALADADFGRNYLRETSFSDASPDTILNYFYALLAMVCLNGSFWGLRNATDIQADLSSIGARRNLAPTHKLKGMLADEAAALLIHYTIILITLAYLAFVLKISLGTHLWPLLSLCLVGCFMGVAFGTFVGSVLKIRESIKTGLLIAITLFLCFLAGLMFADMKNIVAQYAPALQYINPAALLSDGFYSLYMFGAGPRFIVNIALLLGYGALFGIGSYLAVRRNRYASI